MYGSLRNLKYFLILIFFMKIWINFDLVWEFNKNFNLNFRGNFFILSIKIK